MERIDLHMGATLYLNDGRKVYFAGNWGDGMMAVDRKKDALKFDVPVHHIYWDMVKKVKLDTCK